MVGINKRTVEKMLGISIILNDGDIVRAHPWCNNTIAATDPVQSIDYTYPETVLVPTKEWKDFRYNDGYRIKMIDIKSNMDFEFVVDSSVESESATALFRRVASSACDELWWHGEHYTLEEFIDEVFDGEVTVQQLKQRYQYWTDSLWEICVRLSLYDDPENSYYDSSLYKRYQQCSSGSLRIPTEWDWA